MTEKKKEKIRHEFWQIKGRKSYVLTSWRKKKEIYIYIYRKEKKKKEKYMFEKLNKEKCFVKWKNLSRLKNERNKEFIVLLSWGKKEKICFDKLKKERKKTIFWELREKNKNENTSAMKGKRKKVRNRISENKNG